MRTLLILSFICLFMSCHKYLNAIEQALEQAGDNRRELEKVLEHFRKQGKIPFRSACFLIENMPYHQSKEMILLDSAYNSYYNVDKTFTENGYTYQCDVFEKAKFVTLYNKENKFTYVDQVDRYTKQKISIKENMQEKQLEDDSWTKQKCYSIINGAFSEMEKLRVKGRSFGITMFIDPNTGKIAEVKYNFTCMNPYATIPISVFRKIEVELKKNVWFVPTELGKRRNYIIVGWRHEVR